jgi:superoxide reductase
MAERLDIYKCSICNLLIEVIDGAQGKPSCCGQEMEKLTPKTADDGKEKHVPVIEKIDGGYKVKVGSVPHPMEEKHHIEWIELQIGNQTYAQFLNAGDAPEATFKVDGTPTAAREHCNIHGLWKGA